MPNRLARNPEHLKLVAGLSFLMANILAIVAISTPEWISYDLFGRTRIGLRLLCVRLEGEPVSAETCEPFDQSKYWLACYMFIIADVIMTTLTIGWLLMSLMKHDAENIVRPLGFISVLFGSLAAIVFPFGFNIQEIQGDAYKLPEHAHIGYSYFLLCTSVLLSVVAMGICNSDVTSRTRGR